MYTTDVTVRVTTDVEIEPVGEFSFKCPAGKGFVGPYSKVFLQKQDIELSSCRLIVTPKEPAVSEPECEIPMRVTKEIFDKYACGDLRPPKKGEEYLGLSGNIYIATHDFDTDKSLVLTPRTPRYEYPPELMSPEVWGIAADADWDWWIYKTEPQLSSNRYSANTDCHLWVHIAWMFPNVQMPTPDQCNNDWRQSCFKNPQWKGQP